ncbi:hypothetical protein [Cerasicoccus fimbriatus]|uniref:hypothetical protein n=1 Tax=Cerasicoccus fimbriatus TaxID=3014554 RepID=UPI0022B357CF|nr:hypothetical protein [Cerasicoccus sp. TK19100]
MARGELFLFHTSIGIYTDNKLQKLNGTPELDKCIRKLFDPINFIGRIEDLDSFIDNFNQYLAFDKWRVRRNNEKIEFEKLDDVKIEKCSAQQEADEEQFLNQEFKAISIDALHLDPAISDTIKSRLEEIRICLTNIPTP